MISSEPIFRDQENERRVRIKGNLDTIILIALRAQDLGLIATLNSDFDEEGNFITDLTIRR